MSRAPAANHAWKKVLAAGCSHGGYADPVALDAVCRFRDAFRPDVCVHLGDAFDTTAFRSGAVGTADEDADIDPDIDAGIEFIRRFQPTDWLMGNHCQRLWKFTEHRDAKVRKCAADVIKDILACAEEINAKVYPYKGVLNGYDPRYMLRVADFTFLHGVFYSENAARDHAERFGNTVHAHTHRAGYAKGRRSDNPTAISVGWLGDVDKLEYSHLRASTLAWSQGFCWGYFSTGKRARCQLYLHEQPRGMKEWVLPL